MKRAIDVPFEKLEACGNDFIVARAASGRSRRARPHLRLDYGPSLKLLAAAICDRHRGIGADGFLILLPPDDRRNDGRVRFFNADGSEAEMSGNGIRCVARFIGNSRRESHLLRLETPAGVREISRVAGVRGEWRFRVAMGEPILDPKAIPFRDARAAPPITDHPLAAAGQTYRVTVTSMGNPHCSLFVPNFDFDWQAAGRALEAHPAFPNRTNVEFVEVISRSEIAVRFWERGVGETASSGTGSCGASVASVLNGRTGRRIRVRAPAGVLNVEWPKGGEVFLTGSARRVASGIFHYVHYSTR